MQPHYSFDPVTVWLLYEKKYLATVLWAIPSQDKFMASEELGEGAEVDSSGTAPEIATRFSCCANITALQLLLVAGRAKMNSRERSSTQIQLSCMQINVKLAKGSTE